MEAREQRAGPARQAAENPCGSRAAVPGDVVRLYVQRELSGRESVDQVDFEQRPAAVQPVPMQLRNALVELPGRARGGQGLAAHMLLHVDARRLHPVRQSEGWHFGHYVERRGRRRGAISAQDFPHGLVAAHTRRRIENQRDSDVGRRFRAVNQQERKVDQGDRTGHDAGSMRHPQGCRHPSQC